MTVERLRTDATSSLPFQTGDSLPFQTGERNPHPQKDSSIAQKPRTKRRSESVRLRDERRSELFATTDPPPYLQIQSVPIAERVDPERNSYILLILPVGIRAAGGQWSADEAYQILRMTRGWDFSLDKDGTPKCLEEFEALLDSICNKGGAA